MKYLKYLPVMLGLAAICFIRSAEGQKKQFIAPVDADGIQRVDMREGEYFFDPNYVVVKVNIPVEIKIRKEPTLVPHNIVVKAPDAGMDIYESLSTEPKVIKFTPTKTGEYTFYCDKKFLFFKTHRERGMEGVIEVRE